MFNEIYGLYYLMMDKILEKAEHGDISQKDITDIVNEYGFAESSIYFSPKTTAQDGSGYSLLVKSGDKYRSVLKNPTAKYSTSMQLSIIKCMLSDKRIWLFLDDSELNDLQCSLDGIEPLYNNEHILNVGISKEADDYDDPKYVNNFRTVLKAVKSGNYLKVVFNNSKNIRRTTNIAPYKIEYSPREDRFRLCGVSRMGKVYKYIKLNINRIIEAIPLDDTFELDAAYYIEKKRTTPVEIEVANFRNGIERIFIGLSNYKRVSTYDSETGKCTMKIYCDEDDLQELLIVMLSFGPAVKVIGPKRFKEQYIERIDKQMEILAEYQSRSKKQTMNEIIKAKLYEIEKKHDIKILYAVESGSRGWGFASTDSDYDVRFVYIHKMEWYLSIERKRDVIELPINDLLDINGWDIKKTLSLYQKSNPTLLEWFSSPIVYKEQTDFTDKLKKLLDKYFSSKTCIFHYLHMAEGNYREYLKGDKVRIKKYFYVLRPIMACMWVEKFGTQPPMLFEELMNSLDLDKDLISEIEMLLKRKRAGHEMDWEEQITVINKFLEDKIEYFEEYSKNLKSFQADAEELDKLFRDVLEDAWG
ncbi:MAG: nucleotidyltransferase domain-containing protein [Eubacteriales bacterium]